MANQLDELNPEIREEGLDTNVIVKKLPAEVGIGSKIFAIAGPVILYGTACSVAYGVVLFTMQKLG